MRDMIDYIASTFSGGLVFMLLMNFYAGIGETTATQLFTGAVQEDALTAAATMEYDLQKIGFGITDSVKILQSDTTRVAFKSDIDANGTADSVVYFVGSGVTPGSLNAHSKVLYRKVNAGNPVAVAGGVSNFRISYYNAAGSFVTTPQQVRSLRVAMTVESNYGVDNVYPAVCFDRTIKPRNLR